MLYVSENSGDLPRAKELIPENNRFHIATQKRTSSILFGYFFHSINVFYHMQVNGNSYYLIS